MRRRMALHRYGVVDREQRAAIARIAKRQQIDKTVIQQGLLVPLVFMPSIVAYNKNRVGGKVVAPIGQCRSDLAGIYIKK